MLNIEESLDNCISSIPIDLHVYFYVLSRMFSFKVMCNNAPAMVYCKVYILTFLIGLNPLQISTG